MDTNKIQQIKSEIEGLILQAKQKALKAGLSPNSPGFKKRVDELKAKLLKKFSITEEEYANVEGTASKEEVANRIKSKAQTQKEIQDALDEENAKKTTESALKEHSISISKIQKDLMASSIAIKNIDRGMQAWKPFNQDEITELNPSQIKGYMDNQRAIDTKFYGLARFGNDLTKTVDRNDRSIQDLEQRLVTLEKTELIEQHSDLMGIGEDDHHPKLHTLESHIESDLMAKLLYIVSPRFGKSLMDGITSGVVDIAGITKNDADSYYGIITLTFIIDGGGSAIATGIKGDLEIPFACTLVGVTMLADQVGSLVVDIWKDSYANFPPLVGDSIVASAPPTISSAIKSQDETLTGWTTNLTAGDILRFNVNSATTITRTTISLKVSRAVTYG